MKDRYGTLQIDSSLGWRLCRSIVLGNTKKGEHQVQVAKSVLIVEEGRQKKQHGLRAHRDIHHGSQ